MNASATPNDPWVVFNYEVDMFRELCLLLEPDNSQYQDQDLSHYIKCAIVESTVLHTRILVEIILSREPHSDDITLSGLAPGFDCPEIQQLREAYGRRRDKNTPCWTFNKMLAHATSERTDGFDYATSLNRLRPLINNIVDQINVQRN